MDIKEVTRRVCELVQAHAGPGRVERARERQGAVLAWQEADFLPLLMCRSVDELQELPEYDWAEQFADPAKSFVMQMKAVVVAAAGEADALLNIRADVGVITAATVFGAGYQAPAHTKPVVDETVSKERLAAFEVPDDISASGVVPEMIRHTEHHLQTLKDHGLDHLVDVHHCDTQGPFDIAHLARGFEILTDIYDDPEFFHDLMAKTTDVYIKLSRLSKGLIGEEKWGNASGYWMNQGGIRMCEDSSILLSRKCYEENIRSYNEQALDEFGGGWIHYCGSVAGTGRPGGEHLHDVYIDMDNLCGLNFTTSGDLDAEIKKLVDNQCAYIGGYERRTDENLDSYFRRVLRLLPARTGLLLQGPQIKPDEYDRAFDSWYKVQDELFA